jgi:phosphohistidine phosphatase SixA/ADP-ribose pyrophosphatase YjhB (NUDIX family)
VTRKGDSGREVLLVHRPKYDDWSFPKGKLDPGEHVTQTACREVLEETGVEIRLGQPLQPQLYSIGGGRAKTVHYWVGQVVGDDDVSQYRPNNEIDQVSWVPIRQARKQLSYLHDVHLLEQFTQVRRGTRAFILLRHARAMKRATYKGADDSKRPLTQAGKVQARNLSGILHAYGISEILTSDSTRCVKTVAPYAKDQVFKIDAQPELSEESYDADFAAELATRALHARHGIVMCTHRPILPDILDAIGVYEEPLAPGEFVVCHHRHGQLLSVERILVPTMTI